MRSFILLSFCGLTLQLSANVYPPVFQDVMRARYEGDYYDAQAAAWEAIALSDCDTEEAWFQYYKTADYANKFGSGTYDLDDIVESASEVLDPAGFALNYMRCARIFGAEEGWPYLLRAHAAAPDRYEVYPAMITYSTLKGADDQRDDLLVRMHRAEPIPPGVIDYNYNQLVGCPANSILLTVGDADTYPSWLLQAGFDFRTDVEVINLSLILLDESYRRRNLEKLGVELGEFATNEPSAEEIINMLARSERPLMLAVSGRPHYQNLPTERMFLTGLTFQYSERPIDNLGRLHRNYTETWRTERVFNPLATDAGQRVADELGQNYLPALLELRRYYQEERSDQATIAAAQVETRIRRLANRAGIYAEIENFLQDEEVPQLASMESGIKARRLLRDYPPVPSGELSLHDRDEILNIQGFHMGAFEVSNADYQLFLEDLLRQRKFDYLDSAAIIDFELEGLLPDSLLALGMATLEVKGKLNDPNHPVLNISHRAAELYAIWLTQAVNQDPRQAGERRVRFRLPLREEWIYAARGGKMHAPFPWGGPYIRNRLGCYTANFNTTLLQADQSTDNGEVTSESRTVSRQQLDILSDSNGCPDGAWLTTSVESYYPNDFGLYNISGNAAEMLAEPGMTMGGSWLDNSFYMQVETNHEIAQPHPSTGFRLIMEYVD